MNYSGAGVGRNFVVNNKTCLINFDKFTTSICSCIMIDEVTIVRNLTVIYEALSA
jgi:hypothetical protein